MNSIPLDIATLAAVRAEVAECRRHELARLSGLRARLAQLSDCTHAEGAAEALGAMLTLLDGLIEVADADQERYWLTCAGRRALAETEVA